MQETYIPGTPVPKLPPSSCPWGTQEAYTESDAGKKGRSCPWEGEVLQKEKGRDVPISPRGGCNTNDEEAHLGVQSSTQQTRAEAIAPVDVLTMPGERLPARCP